MTKLYYPYSTGNSFPFRVFLNIETQQYWFDQSEFEQGSWFGDADLEWEGKERVDYDLMLPTAIDHLKNDCHSQLILYAASETIGRKHLVRRIAQINSMGIKNSQIHFIVPSMPQKHAMERLYPEISLSAFNHWEMHTASKTLRWDTDLEPQTKFLYLNRRNSYERLLLAYLILNNSDLKDNINYSLHPASYWETQNRAQQLEHFRSVLRQIPDQYRHSISRWCLTAPWKSIPSPQRQNPYTYQLFDTDTEQLIKNHSLSIITESHPYHSSYCFMPTEKTCRVIAASRPFVVLGTQYFLQNLRDQGYRTFSDYWSEDYDREPNLYRRIEMIYEILQYINTLSTETIHTITREICEHNRQQLRQRTGEEEVKKYLHPTLAELVSFSKPTCPYETA